MTAAVDRERDRASERRSRVVMGAAAVLGVVVLGAGIVLRPVEGPIITPLTPAPLTAQPVTVTEIISGDSLVIRINAPGPQWQEWSTLTVRLAGAEVGASAESCHAEVAREHLATLLPIGALAWATVGADAPDADGRWPVFLWSKPTQFVNGVLAGNGDLRPIIDEVPHEYAYAIAQGAEVAFRQGMGMWGTCS